MERAIVLKDAYYGREQHCEIVPGGRETDADAGCKYFIMREKQRVLICMNILS